MKRPRDTIRIGVPVLHAFRAAFLARDARKVVDERDESGRRIIARRRTAARAAITASMLRQEIMHDLEALLNTVHLAATQPLDALEEVERSILNFGIPDLVHRGIDEDLADVSRDLKTALARFEPRIAAQSLDVRKDADVDSTELKVRFVIACELLLAEQNAEVAFVADIAVNGDTFRVSQT